MSGMNRTDSTPPAIQDYLDYREYLRDWFSWKKAASPRFSQRAFARRMGQSSPSIGVDLVAGRRSLTPALFGPLAKALDLDADQRGYLQLLVNLDRAKTPQQRNGAWDRLSAHRWFRQARRVEGEGFRYVSDWTCPAVRELASRPDFRADPAWIARTLVPAISESRAQRTLDTLFELGLLVLDDDGQVQQAEASVVTPSEVQGLAAHNYHHGMFELAREGITRFDSSERHYTGVTVCVPESLVPDLKREIVEFAERLLERCDRAEGDPERVYQVHLAAFPLSRSKDDP
jgi:uncharacterized protein (TIGR02147 family)